MKKMKSMICALVIMLWVTATAIPAFASPKVKEAEYEGNGRVEVEFKTNVKYKNLKVSVTDTKGNKYDTKINSKDNDDLTFTILKFKKGVTYKYTIAGIKQKNEKNYGQVTGKITIPAATTGPKLKKAEYDNKDKELEIDFTTKVQWNSPKVTISDGKTNYVVRIKDKDNDSIELKVKNMVVGKKYTYKITGIKVKGNNAYQTISGTLIPVKD